AGGAHAGPRGRGHRRAAAAERHGSRQRPGDPLSRRLRPLVESLAAQAAVAIDNARLIRSLEDMFEAFVRVMASAIDERSPATRGHIERVTALTMELAEAVNACDEPPFAHVRFSDDELNELRIAALVHDVGKVTTRLHIIEKRTKLEGVRDGIDVIRERFATIKEAKRNEFLRRRLELLQRGAAPGDGAALDEEEAAALAELGQQRYFVVACNQPAEFMPDDHVQRLKEIASRTYVADGVEKPYLTEDELALLCIQRGNISGEELRIMRDHVSVTMRLLDQSPFPNKLKGVPRYAGGHHEKLNGKGYPPGPDGRR